jgi:hypothetical protein
VYLVVVGWLYVVVMMVVVEAMSPTGSILGAIVTFFLYGLLPVALVIYLMSGPYRRRIMRAREAAEERAHEQRPDSSDPDAGGHAAGAAETDGIASVREEPR